MMMQQLLAQLLMGQQQPPLPRGGNNIDPMVVPPFGLPPDKNTMMPHDLMPYLQNPWAMQEKT